MSSHEITHLVEVYGCAVVFAATALQALGAPVPGTTVLVAAAVYAAAGHGLPIAGVIAAGAGGALIGTLAGYGIGRWRGAALLAWLAHRLTRRSSRRSARRSAQRTGRGEMQLQRFQDELNSRGLPWLFVARFITGLRNIAGLVAGAAGMPLRRFLPVSAAAALAWALLNGLEYYLFGRALIAAPTWLQILLVVLGLAGTVVTLHLLRRRAARSYNPEALTAEETDLAPPRATPTNETRPARTP